MPQSAQIEKGRYGNRLLEMLSERDANRVLMSAERLHLPLRRVLSRLGEPAEFAYFPLSCVLSAIVPLRDGSAIEAGTIGNEGMASVDLLAHRTGSVYQTIVQIEGEALQLSATNFRSILDENTSVAELIERYALTMIHQASQSAACNLRHSIEERMARWLLMTHDRVGHDEFFLAQEFLGIMLGVRRQSVSLTAATLYEAGLLTYTRGSMKMLNRAGLELVSCECYHAIRETYDQVMQPKTT